MPDVPKASHVCRKRPVIVSPEPADWCCCCSFRLSLASTIWLQSCNFHLPQDVCFDFSFFPPLFGSAFNYLSSVAACQAVWNYMSAFPFLALPCPPTKKHSSLSLSLLSLRFLFFGVYGNLPIFLDGFPKYPSLEQPINAGAKFCKSRWRAGTASSKSYVPQIRSRKTSEKPPTPNPK